MSKSVTFTGRRDPRLTAKPPHPFGPTPTPPAITPITTPRLRQFTESEHVRFTGPATKPGAAS